jgi:hypothetical protein
MSSNISTERESFRKSLTLSDFVEEAHALIADYKCPLCGGIYLNPVVDTCGHIFCNECLIQYLQTSDKCCVSGLPCALQNVNKIELIASILDRQFVFCKNRHFHCEWSGRLMELEPHLNQDCRRQILPCPHMGCINSVFREDLSVHTSSCDWRIVACPSCEVLIACIEIPEHQKTCPRYKVKCHQNCEMYIERQYVESHVTDHCENTIVDCPFKIIGCLTKISRGQLENYLTLHTNRHNLQVLRHLTNIAQDVQAKVNSRPDYSNSLASMEERLKKVELFMGMQVQLLKEREPKENLNPNIQNNEVFSQKTNLICQISPNKDSLANNSKSSGFIQLDSPGKLMNRKRQRTEDEENPININKPEKIILSDLEEKDGKSDEISPSMQCDPQSPLFSISQEIKVKENIFDSTNISRGLVVCGTKVSCPAPTKMEHKYVFANIVLSTEKETEWRVIMNVKSNWAAIGLCTKDTVISNKYRFITSNPSFFNGTFAVSTNGYSWNCQNMAENNFNLPNFPTISPGDKIDFKYSPDLKELSFKISNKLSGKLTNVTAHKSGSLVPCFIFLHSGDEIILERN